MAKRTIFARTALAVSALLAVAVCATMLVRTGHTGRSIPAIGMSLAEALAVLGPTAFFGATCDRETEVHGNVAYTDIETGGRQLHIMAFVDQGEDRVFAVEMGTDPVRVASRDRCAALDVSIVEDLLSRIAPTRMGDATVRTAWKDFEGAGDYTTCRMNWRVTLMPSPFSTPEYIGPDGISDPIPLENIVASSSP